MWQWVNGWLKNELICTGGVGGGGGGFWNCRKLFMLMDATTIE